MNIKSFFKNSFLIINIPHILILLHLAGSTDWFEPWILVICGGLSTLKTSGANRWVEHHTIIRPLLPQYKTVNRRKTSKIHNHTLPSAKRPCCHRDRHKI